MRDGFVTVALCWIVISLLGAVPFVITGEIPSYLDAVFEIVSGFTTIILAQLFIGGIQALMIGILGEYLWRVLAQARQDSPFIVEEELS